MNKIIFVLLLFFSFPAVIDAQDKEKIKGVEAAVEELKSALISGDRKALESVTMEKLSYGHSSGVIENRTQFIEKLASGQSDFVTINTSQQMIEVSDNTALVRHRLDAQINDNGKAGEVHLLVLLVWQKTGKRWKLLARQAVKAPQ